MNTPNTTSVKQTDIFISWNSLDRELKNIIFNNLKDNYVVWESDSETVGNITDNCLTNIRLSKLFIVILTENSIKSNWVIGECLYALENYNNYQNRIIVISKSQDIFNDFSDILINTNKTNKRLNDLSGIILDNYDNINLALDKINHNVNSLLITQTFYEFKDKQVFKSIPIPLLSSDIDKVNRITTSYDEIYIDRKVNSKLDNKELNEDEFLNLDGITVITGDGGSGKTQYLRHLVNTYSKSNLESLLFYIEFTKISSYLTDNNITLIDILYKVYKEKLSYEGYNENHFKALLKSKENNLILILDGADEVSINELTNINKLVKDFYDKYSNTRIIITTRKLSDKAIFSYNNSDIKEYTLTKLTENEKKALIHNIFVCIGNNEGEEEFYISLNKVSNELVDNPLLLTQIAVIYNKDGSIPNTLYEIYDKASKLLIEEREQDKNINIDSNINNNILTYLNYAAYGRFIDPKAKYENLIAKEINKEVNNPKESLNKAKKLIEYLNQRALIVNNEFAHKMFLEFFTAMKIYEDIYIFDELNNKEELIHFITKYYYDDRWENIIKILVSKIVIECDEENIINSINIIIDNINNNYHLLCESIPKNIDNGILASKEIIKNILNKIYNKTIHPYSELFVYVPIYNMYESLASLILDNINTNTNIIIELSLLRDMAVMYEGVNTLEKLSNKYNFIDKDIVNKFDKLISNKESNITQRYILNSLFYNKELKDNIINYLDNKYSNNYDNTWPEVFNISNYYYLYKLDRDKDYEYNYISHTKLFKDELDLFNINNDKGLLILDNSTYNININTNNIKDITGICYISSNTDTLELNNYMPSLSVLILSPEIEKISAYAFAYLGENTHKFSLFPYDNIKELNSNTKLHLSHNLYEVYLYGNIESISGLFNNHKLLKHISMPQSINKIGWHTFKECIGLEYIILPNSLKKIYDSAFYKCKNLKTVKLPSSVEEIERSVFLKCQSLKSINIPKNVKRLGNDLFKECYDLTNITFEGKIESITSFMFYCCWKLKNVSLPNTIKKICSCAFLKCHNLENILLPNSLEEIQSSAFNGCKALTKVTIPSKVKYIDSCAFACCDNLKEVVFEGDDVVINEEAFRDCLNLDEKTKKYIDDHIDKKIKVKKLSFNKDATGYKITHEDLSKYDKGILEEVYIGEGITTIDTNAFLKCRSLKKVVLPESLKSIGEKAFYGCYSLEEIIIPEGLLLIKEEAFALCIRLRKINIPNSVVKISNYVFSACGSLEKITIPNSIDEIGINMFLGCSSLKSINLPNRIHKIGLGAFMGCKLLNKVVIPCNVDEIKASTFEGCDNLISINLENIKYIRRQAFKGCFNLSDLLLSNNLTIIESKAFYECTSLNKIYISDSVMKIEHNAFKNCTGLLAVRLSENINELEESTFENCISLKEITIPNKVKFIAPNAFSGCKLEKVTIPKHLLNVSKSVFEDYEILEEHEDNIVLKIK